MNYKDTVNFQTNLIPRDAIPYTTGKRRCSIVSRIRDAYRGRDRTNQQL